MMTRLRFPPLLSRHLRPPVFGRRRRMRLGAWGGLVLLALEIFLGTAIPLARAAQSDRMIPIADLMVCTIDGMMAATPDGQGMPEASVFCSACLPLVQMLAPPEAPSFRVPARIHAYVFVPPQHPWPVQDAAQGFSARAPPSSV
ncbi:hypothetical protein [Magnetospirillum gryphiswaldense]|nr:hypothetical protein [Magnetospirillum gryphiswaldense]